MAKTKTTLGEVESWQIFLKDQVLYRVILHPLCKISSMSNGSSLCLNMTTNLTEMVPMRTEVSVSRET